MSVFWQFCYFAVLAFGYAEGAVGPYLLVAERNQLTKLSLDGQIKETFLSQLKYPVGLVSDTRNGLIFYSDVLDGTINRVYQNGTGAVTIVEGLGNPRGLTVDPVNRTIYWTSRDDGKIGSADYNGDEVHTILSNLGKPYGIYLNVSSGHIYWTDTSRETINRADRDGSNHIAITKRYPTAIVVAGDSVFFFDPFDMIIYKFDVVTLSKTTFLSGVEHVNGLAVYGPYLYFTQLYDGSVTKVNIYNQTDRHKIATGLTYPTRIAIGASRAIIVLAKPFLRINESRSDTIQFLCHLPDTDEVELQVTWKSGSNNISTEVVTGKSAILEISNKDALQRGIKSMIQCIVQTRTAENGDIHLGPESHSNVFEAKIELLTKTLDLDEGKTGDVHVLMNAPPVFFGSESLNLILALKREKSESRTHSGSGEIIPQFKMNAQPGKKTSRIHVTGENWFENHKFQVLATPDGKTDGTQIRTLQLIIDNVEGKGLSRRKRQLWDNNNSTNCKAMARDMSEDNTCRAVNDPHMTTADQTCYENQLQGEFIFYRHRENENYQINVFFQPCIEPRPTATCICAVYIKCRNDVLVYDKCIRQSSGSYRPSTNKAIRQYLIRNENDTFVYDSHTTLDERCKHNRTDGTTKFIELGGEVTVENELYLGYLQVYYKPGETDSTYIQGLCGHYDRKNKSDDFTLRDGTVIAVTRYPDKFNNDWRPHIDESLLHGSNYRGIRIAANGSFIICVVMVDANGNIDDSCGNNPPYSPDQTRGNLNMPVFPAQHNVNVVRAARRKRSVNTISAGFNPFDPIVADVSRVTSGQVTWPTASGRTEQEARDLCNGTIFGHPGVPVCAEMMNLTFEDEISACIWDIGMVDDLRFIDSALAAILETCVIYENAMDTTAADGEPPPPLPNGVNRTQLLNSLCVTNCSGRGVCNNRVCQCEEGYIGSDCSMHLNDPPEVAELMLTFCDVNEVSCGIAVVYGDKFQDRKTLTCHLQAYTLGDSLPDSEPTNVPGIYARVDQVVCQVPKDKPHIIRISNDGIKKAPQGLLYYVYNSTCLECIMDDMNDITSARCERQANTCMINGECYVDSDINPVNRCEICDSDRSDTSWSNTRVDGCGSGIGSGLDVVMITVVTTVSVVTVIIIIVVVAKKLL